MNGLSTSATANSKAAELDLVQTAVDIYLTTNYPTITTITARAAPAVLTAADADCDFCAYLRSLPTEYTYSWTADGNVTQP